jgi:hypothetical protein
MADELIMQALEEAYKLVLFHRNQRAAGLRLVAQADEEIAKVTPKIIGLAALVDVPEDSELRQFVLEMASMGITDAVHRLSSALAASTLAMLMPLIARTSSISSNGIPR